MEGFALVVTIALSQLLATEHRLPSNFKVPEKLQPVLEDVARRSPKFRGQLQELRHHPHVRMTVSYGNLSIWHVVRAESHVEKYEFGAVRIDTRLYTAEDVVDVIAHELEHVCEQMEGIDVRALAHQRGSGVSDVGGHYETKRAVMAGHQVAEEATGVKADAVLLASASAHDVQSQSPSHSPSSSHSR
jgi:hypothetical protein